MDGFSVSCLLPLVHLRFSSRLWGKPQVHRIWWNDGNSEDYRKQIGWKLFSFSFKGYYLIGINLQYIFASNYLQLLYLLALLHDKSMFSAPIFFAVSYNQSSENPQQRVAILKFPCVISGWLLQLNRNCLTGPTVRHTYWTARLWGQRTKRYQRCRWEYFYIPLICNQVKETVVFEDPQINVLHFASFSSLVNVWICL